MELDITKQSTDLAIRTQGLMVIDQESLALASECLMAGKGLIKYIKDKFVLPKRAADEAKKKLLDWEREELGKVEPIVTRLDRAIVDYRVAEERKRQAAEQERRRQEEERRRLAEKALKEAEEKERQARAAEARAALEKDAEARRKAKEEAAKAQAEADKIINKAVEEEKSFEPVVVVPEKVVTKGTAIRHNWKFRVTDLASVPIEYHLINEVVVGRLVRNSEGKIQIPGIEVYDEPSTVSTR